MSGDQAWHDEAFKLVEARLAFPDAPAVLDSVGWRLLSEPEERETLRQGLLSRYPSREVCPILRRDDSDDVLTLRRPWPALPDARPVLLIHDYAAPGWENEGEWPDFEIWLREVIPSAPDGATP